MRKLERELRREFPFAEVETARSGHLRLRLPNGRMVSTASTLSCPFFLRRRLMRHEPSGAGR